MSLSQSLRYDFVADKLDLSRFIKNVRRHAFYHFDIQYYIYFKNYKLDIFIDFENNVKFHLVEMIINSNGEIDSFAYIFPHKNTKFHTCDDLVKFYDLNNNISQGKFTELDTEKLIDNLVGIIKIVFKIDQLILFI